MRSFRCVWASEVKSPWQAEPTVFVYAKTVTNHVKFWEAIKDDASSSYFLMVSPIMLGPDDDAASLNKDDVQAACKIASGIENAKAGLGHIRCPDALRPVL